MQLPSSFVERMRSLLGAEYTAFEAALADEPSVSVRFNRLKTTQQPSSLKPVPWCENGYYMDRRPPFTFDPLFHAGHYYVQEASSMFLQRVIESYVDSSVRYLDLCAAPGGKTTLAISALPEGSLVIGNEIDRKRSQILAENITKWGSPFSLVTNNRPADFSDLTHYFDVILTDVPCSGEGMFRKDEQAIEEWSEANVQLCVDRQKGILQDIWPALRPGGLLIYSTCTYNVDENERMIAYMVEEFGAEVLPVDVDSQWGIRGPLEGDLPVYRFMPHTTHGEGLFMAVVRKPDDEMAYDRSRLMKDSGKKSSKKEKPVVVDPKLKTWLADSAQFDILSSAEGFVAYPKVYSADMQMLSKRLKTHCVGVALAQAKGKDLMPQHALALSIAIDKGAFEVAEVDQEDALTYLRREAIVLPEDTAKGFVLLTFKGQALGFVKNIGNRSNNLYPPEWRIRSGYNPDKLWTMGEER